MDGMIWLLLPLFVAAGSALLAYFIMQSRMDVALAKEREALADAHAKLRSQQVTIEERVKAAEEAVRRKALDEFMQEFRVEERSYMRESNAGPAARKSMILQERLYFRNIPLSNWIEHEMLVEDGAPKALPEPAPAPMPVPMYNGKNLAADSQAAMSRLMDQAAMSRLMEKIGIGHQFSPTPGD